jgi:CRP/FNR family transcriptional regulator
MARRAEGRHRLTERDLSIDAVRFDAGTNGRSAPLLTAAQRLRLMALATTLHLPPRTTVYREEDALSYVFVIGEGLVKSFRELPSGRRRIVAFLFPRDIFGLAENGRYVNTTRTVTESMLYRIPYESFTVALQRDADLQFRFLCKVTQKLREAQRQAVVLGRRDAVGRVAMLLKMLERQSAEKSDGARIPVPMSRTDIAEYLGLSLEAVSRATRKLALRRIVAFVDGRSARVTDRARFESLVAAV